MAWYAAIRGLLKWSLEPIHQFLDSPLLLDWFSLCTGAWKKDEDQFIFCFVTQNVCRRLRAAGLPLTPDCKSGAGSV